MLACEVFNSVCVTFGSIVLFKCKNALGFAVPIPRRPLSIITFELSEPVFIRKFPPDLSLFKYVENEDEGSDV